MFADKKYQAAIDEFLKIIENNPNGALSQQALFRIATIQYLYLSRYQEAIKSFRQFVVLSKSENQVFQAEKHIGEILFSKLEDFAGSTDQYKRILEKYPKSEETSFFVLRLAKSYYGTLNFDATIKVLKEFENKFPKTELMPEALYQLANTYYTKGDCEAAIDIFESVVFGFPKSQQAVFAQFGIGNCFEELDKPLEALQMYQGVLGRYPSPRVVQTKIARLKVKQSKKTK
jgi:TolA-binding protein